MSKFPRVSCFLTLAALLYSLYAQADIAQTDRLVLNATLVYDGKQPLPTPGAADFTVLVDKQPQKIVSFNQDNAPVSVGILVDVSSSAR